MSGISILRGDCWTELMLTAFGDGRDGSHLQEPYAGLSVKTANGAADLVFKTVEAGTVQQVGETSIAIEGTSQLQTLGSESEIHITGLNNVAINNTIGRDNANLSLLQIKSTQGTLSLDKASGWLESAERMELQGQQIDLAGVLRNTGTSADLDDYEVEGTLFG